jgi:zinc D-Ala-D-Ala dipeptidase
MTKPDRDPAFAAVPIRDRGEMLINVAAHSPLRVAKPHNVTGGQHSPPYLRTGVVDRLVAAQSLLPRDVLLLVVAGHLPAILLPETTSDSGTASPERTGVALTAVDSAAVPLAAHYTGGAVDLTLCAPIDAPFPLDRRGTLPTCLACGSGLPVNADADMGQKPQASDRTLLTSALTDMGFVNHPMCWWHWSYGDQYWAFQKAVPQARYGAVSQGPPGNRP